MDAPRRASERARFRLELPKTHTETMLTRLTESLAIGRTLRVWATSARTRVI